MAKRNTIKNGIAFTGKSWSYVLRIPNPATGKTKPSWVGGFATEKDAKLARDKARVSLATGDFVPVTSLTVGDYLATWIKAHAQRIKPTTLYRYEEIIENYLIPCIGGVKLQQLRPHHIASMYTDLMTKPALSGKPLSRKTVHFYGSILKTALKHAVEVDGYLNVNPATRVPLPNSQNPNLAPWTFSELKQFLVIARTHRLFFFYWLSAFTGARRGELLALRWSDFDGSAISITKNRTKAGKTTVENLTTKGGNNGQRRVKLDPETVKEFNAHRIRQKQERLALGELWQDTGYVFVREDGLPLYVATPSDVFRKLSRKHGLRLTRVHDLRHLHATELLRQGEPLHVVANRLGHRDAMTTATIYAHVSNEQAETASLSFATAFNNG
jgi:integrase